MWKARPGSVRPFGVPHLRGHSTSTFEWLQRGMPFLPHVANTEVLTDCGSATQGGTNVG